MAIKRPDIYEHSNPNNAFVDSDFVRGGMRSPVADLTELYALETKTDQLKENSTTVWVFSEEKYFVLIDITKVGISDGWEGGKLGSGSGNQITIQIPSGTGTKDMPFDYKPFPLNTTGTLQKGDYAVGNWVEDDKYSQTLEYIGADGVELDAVTPISDWKIRVQGLDLVKGAIADDSFNIYESCQELQQAGYTLANECAYGTVITQFRTTDISEYRKASDSDDDWFVRRNSTGLWEKLPI